MVKCWLVKMERFLEYMEVNYQSCIQMNSMTFGLDGPLLLSSTLQYLKKLLLCN